MMQPTALIRTVTLILASALFALWPAIAQNEIKGIPTKVDPGKELDQIINHPSGEQAKSFEEVIDRAVNSERMLMRRLRDKSPVIETYIQETKGDPDLGFVPKDDFYFLGQLNMRDGVIDMSYLPPRSKVKAVTHTLVSLFTTQYNSHGFSDQLFIDVNDFDRAHYSFEYIRREFLGDVRCFVVDVAPSEGAGKRRFKGRVWIEDRDYNIVRFQGQYQPSNYHEHIHFECWRVNSGGMWLPAYVYSQEEEYRSALVKTAAMRAQTRLWAYERAHEKTDEAFTNMTVDVPQGVKDDSDAAADYSPLQSYRIWEEEAAQNVIDRLLRAGLIAPPGEVDQVLETVLNNLLVSAGINLDFKVKARILLTTPLESMTLNHTILLSRGLIDVLPDEASLAAVLSHELAHIVLGHSMNTKYAFEDRLLFDDPAIVRRVQVGRDRQEEAAADEKAIEILKKSPYKDSLPKVGLFLRMLSERSEEVPHLIKPLLGNKMSDSKKDLRLSGLMDQAPTLQLRDKDQISALPLGSRIKMDPWSDQLHLIKSTPTQRYAARDKMPFEITPFMLHLTREDKSGAGSATPAAEGPTTAPAPSTNSGGTPNESPVGHP
jgi:peptidase M48-like protein